MEYCTNKKCTAYFKTDESGDTVIESKLDHNHKKDVQYIMVRQVIRNSLKEKHKMRFVNGHLN